MYQIPPFQEAITLFFRDGSSTRFSSLALALRTLGYAWISHNVGGHFKIFTGYSNLSGPVVERLPTYSVYEYVMRNDVGDCINIEHFNALRIYRSRWSQLPSHYSWRSGPVPGIHHYSAGVHYCRRIKYANARKAAQYFDSEMEPAPRAKRNLTNLPTNWDDYRVGSREIRNWKQFRNTQWKA